MIRNPKTDQNMINMDSHQFQIQITAVIRYIQINRKNILSDSLIMTIVTLVIFFNYYFLQILPLYKAMARKTGKVAQTLKLSLFLNLPLILKI